MKYQYYNLRSDCHAQPLYVKPETPEYFCTGCQKQCGARTEMQAARDELNRSWRQLCEAFIEHEPILSKLFRLDK